MPCGRKDSVKQMVSSLTALAWIERSVRLERRPQMFEIHIVMDRWRNWEVVGQGGGRLCVDRVKGGVGGWDAGKGMSRWGEGGSIEVRWSGKEVCRKGEI